MTSYINYVLVISILYVSVCVGQDIIFIFLIFLIFLILIRTLHLRSTGPRRLKEDM